MLSKSYSLFSLFALSKWGCHHHLVWRLVLGLGERRWQIKPMLPSLKCTPGVGRHNVEVSFHPDVFLVFNIREEIGWKEKKDERPQW